MIMGILLLIVLLGCISFGAGLVSAVVARFKGYRPWFWVLSLGPVGLLLILVKPNLGKATTPEMREQWEQRADWTGGVLSCITLFFLIAALPVSGVWFYSFAAAPVKVMAPMISTTATLAPGAAAQSMIDGVSIEVLHPTSHMVSQSTATFDEGNRRGTRSITTWEDDMGAKLGECIVEVASSKLRVNGKEYGPVAPGDFVVVNGDSVQVNGVIRSEEQDQQP